MHFQYHLLLRLRWNQSVGRDDWLMKVHGSDKEVRFPAPLVSVNVDVVEMYSEDKILCSHKPEVLSFKTTMFKYIYVC